MGLLFCHVGIREAPGVPRASGATQDHWGDTGDTPAERRTRECAYSVSILAAKRETFEKLDHGQGKKHRIGASFRGRNPTRFRRTLAEADVTWETQPCARTPTQHLHHRHPTVARRPPCCTGHASKGDCTLYPNEFPVYFLCAFISRSRP